ncbi:insulinase family protein [Candidatus Comchoanobacter bicostacola]|uniref:Protease 3 n=1 Tax=Candidatus Comchoanobacter bicostacola TaxID=2919598 RepID=A0ABY5DJJ4_9GAMM|nr:insulinase family protein [Candidatus Comchoanobacter bicostacola]UTC24197.1 insulinase family protein [Candidatus Comchoanobacter bicostacola]
MTNPISSFLSSFLVLFICTLSYAIEQGPLDPRTFDFHQLDNGLKVLFITDPDAEISASSMMVDVGTNSDPKGFEGLAHFLEHMLFIGTKKYPEVDYLQSYVAQHGGYTNAYTAFDHTQYYFSVNSDYFEHALDAFTEFFLEPTLDEAYVERERNAVNAEFEMNKSNDGWRMYHVNNITANPKHPGSRFTIGDLNTLSDHGEQSLLENLKLFYKQHYIANNMYFVSVSPRYSEGQKAMIIDKLSMIREGNKSLPITEHKFNQSAGSLLKIKTLREMNTLEVQFSIPRDTRFQSPALAYLSHILGHEGPGTLTEVLKRQDLIQSLGVSSNHLSDIESVFSVSLELTQLGSSQIDYVLSSLHDYLELIKRNGVESWRFYEMQRSGMLDYLFYQNINPIRQVSLYPKLIQQYPIEYIEKAQSVTNIHHFDETHINSVLGSLRLNAARIIYASNDVETDRYDDIFDVNYSVQPISAQQYQKWSRQSEHMLKLPGKNIYLPSQLDQVSGSQDQPSISHESKNLRIWKMMDASYALPKQYVNLRLYSSQVKDPLSYLYLHLTHLLLDKELSSTLYPAYLAGLSSSLRLDNEYLNLRISGLGNKHIAVAQQVLDQLDELDATLTRQFFEQSLATLRDNLSNFKYAAPYRYASINFYNLIQSSNFLLSDLNDQVDLLSYESLKAFIQDYKSSLEAEAFIYGYLGENATQDLEKTLLKYIPNEAGAFTRKMDKGVMQVKDYDDLSFNTEHGDMALLRVYQSNMSDLTAKVSVNMIQAIYGPEFFEQLRTEKQIGYIVALQSLSVSGWPHIMMVAQSPAMQPDEISKHMDLFLEENQRLIVDMDPNLFEEIKQSLIDRYQQTDKNMTEVNHRYGSQILNHHYVYDLDVRAASEVELMTQSQLQRFFEDNVLNNNNRLDLKVEKGNVESSLAEKKSSSEFSNAQIWEIE